MNGLLGKLLMLLGVMFVVTPLIPNDSHATHPPAKQRIVSTINVLRKVLELVAIGEGEKRQVLFIQINNIKKGEVNTQTYSLYGGRKYLVVAVGDANRITDIDLSVQVVGGPAIGTDQERSNIAAVTIPPLKARRAGSKIRFEFNVKAFRTAPDMSDGFYALIVYRLS